MQGEAEKTHSAAGRSGPQGTQVYSREEIAALLDEGASTDASPRARARLVLLSSESGGADQGGSGRVFPLGNDRVTVGRSHICDVCIEEASMSSEHARLVRSDDAWRIINLLSTNGVFVNGEKVFSHRLTDGDEIRLGRTILRFQDPSEQGGDSRAAAWMPWAGVLVAAAAVALLAFWLLV